MKRFWLLLLAILLLLLTIAPLGYCKAPVRLKFMHWWGYVDDNIIKVFEKENPGVKIDMEYVAIDQYFNKLKMLSVSNETPDVFALQDAGFTEFAKQNKLMDCGTQFYTGRFLADYSGSR